MTELLLAKGLISFCGSFLGKNLANKTSEQTIDDLFYKKVKLVSSKIQEKYPKILGGSIDIIFTDETIFNNLITILKIGSEIRVDEIYNKLDKGTLPKEFVEEFINLLKEELSDDYLFNRLLSEKELYNKVDSIESILTQYMSSNFTYNEFIDIYKNNAVNNIMQVNYFGLSLSPEVKKARKRLVDIYVIPSFSVKDTKARGNLLTETNNVNNDLEDIEEIDFYDETINFNDLLEGLIDDNKHLVILGKPGSGKSTLMKYLMYIVLNRQSNNRLNEILPFRIELRKYLQFKKQHNLNLTRYLHKILESEYSIESLDYQQLVNIMNNENTMLLFDGLDEIFDINDKIELKNDIENFLSNNPRCKGIVTSRVIGYEDAKLNEEDFREIEICDFNDSQIREYVEKWYIENEKEQHVLEREVNEFIELTNELGEELVSNPLSLSLIVILYRNNGKVPNSKLDIYRGCTNTLVEEWDENKNLRFELAVKNKKVSIFTNLAYWQYTRLSEKQKSGSPVTNISVKNEVQRIIRDLNITDDYNEAERFAKEFLDYAEKRSIYFDNNFTHKTFHEYYTALWIFQSYEVKGKFPERDEIISKYIDNPYWHIVLELLICMIDERQGDEEVIDTLINKQTSKDNGIYHNYFFMDMIKNIVNVSEETIKKVLKRLVSFCIESTDYSNGEFVVKQEICKQISHTLDELSSVERFKNIFNEVLSDIFEEVKNSEDEILIFMLFTLEMDTEIVRNSYSYEEYKKWAYKSKFIYIRIFRRPKNSNNDISKFIELFGIDELFNFIPDCYSNALSAPYIMFYLIQLKHMKDKKMIREGLEFLDLQGLDMLKVKESVESLNIWGGEGSIEFKEVCEEYFEQFI